MKLSVLPMTWRSYTVVSGAGILATWLASGPPSTAPAPAAHAVRQAAAPARPVSDQGADIQEQAARLQAKLRQEAAYREPTRNLFRFVERPASPPPAPAIMAPQPFVAPLNLVAEPAALRIALSGITEDTTPDGVTRTAVISTPSDVFLARTGDVVAGQYKVMSVEADAVHLSRIDDGSTLRLSLRP